MPKIHWVRLLKCLLALLVVCDIKLNTFNFWTVGQKNKHFMKQTINGWIKKIIVEVEILFYTFVTHSHRSATPTKELWDRAETTVNNEWMTLSILMPAQTPTVCFFITGHADDLWEKSQPEKTIKAVKIIHCFYW